MARGNIDWVGIQASYRSGQLPTLEIARRYGLTEGAIRYRAKREEWQQDLTPEYQAGVKTAILRSPTNRPLALVKVAKDLPRNGRKTSWPRRSRKASRSLSSTRSLVELLSSNSMSIAEIIKDEIAEVQAASGKALRRTLSRRSSSPRRLSLTNRLALLAKAHDILARASVNAVAIERQSRGLDDMPADPSAPTSIS